MTNHRRQPRLLGIRAAALVTAWVLAAVIAAPAPGQQATQPPAAPGSGQAEGAPPSPANGLSLEQIQARVAALEAVLERDETQQAELAQLKSAVAFLSQTAQAQADAAAFEELVRTAPERLQQINDEITGIKAQLALPLQDTELAVPDGATRDELAALLETRRTQLDAAKKFREGVEEEFRKRNERRELIAGEIATARKRLDEIDLSLAATPDPNEPALLTQARRANLQAERQYSRTTIDRLEKESASYEARKNLIAARLERARGRESLADRSFKAVQERLDEMRRKEAEQTLQSARREQAEAAGAHPIVRTIRDENTERAKELDEVLKLATAENTRKQQTADLYTEWSRALERVRVQVNQIGLSVVIGLHLRDQRSRLPDLRQLEAELRATRQKMRQAQSERLRLETLSFADPAEEAERRIAESDPPVDERRREDVRNAAVEALSRQAEILAEMEAAYERYSEQVLIDLHGEQQKLVDLTAEYLTFIDERILWIRSADPIGWSDATATGGAVVWLVNPAHWWEAARELGGDFRSRPGPPLAGLLLLLLVLIVQRRARKRLRDLAKSVKRASTDRFGLSVAAGLLTIVIALPGPLLLSLLGWRLGDIAGASEFTVGLSAALKRIAVLLLTATFLYHLCRPSGLAEAHFRWTTANLKLLRRQLRWYVPVLLLMSFAMALTDPERPGPHHNSLGRLAFLAAMVATAVFVFRVFRPKKGVLRGLIAASRGGWLDRLRFVWFPFMVAAPLILAIVAGLGFFYTALRLEQQALDTIWLILSGVVLYALLLRWLFVAQRRLAVQQAKKKLAAQAKARAEEAKAGAEEGREPAAPAPPAGPPVDELELDVAATSAQTRSLLRSTVFFLLVVGVFVMWADVTPALGILDDVTLWSQVESAAADVAPAEGDDAAAPASLVVAITLADLGLALVILAITFIVSRNIPGLLEFTVLQRLPLEPGARYAITTLARYLLVVIGVVLAFNAIGIGWSKVQFLAAAITVGLGFGLQEIFANFVSGLILLFERPIRLGDTVTVGSVNGTVSRIRIRATTITDWDRKELVIPNREFVTGQIVNWSLSDSIIRLTIPVGIAYGSDTKTARELLLKVAGEQKRVLADPAPKALFLGFGESSLDFELRVFVPHIDYLLPTRSDLHFAIDQAFREAGIEIAFPQRDIHVRSIKAALPLASERVDPRADSG